MDLTERAGMSEASNAPRATPWHAPSARREDDPSVTPAQDASREASRGGVVHALREAAKQSGLDPIAELYNEALRYANENHLRLARERLQILLCMAPDDAEARLTLARVYAAESRWAEALAELDLASACGFDVPGSLRKAVEEHVRAEKARAEKATEDVNKRPARERDEGEVRSLRQEAKRLRTENAQHTARVAQLEREVRRWAWLTAALSTLAIGFIGVTLTFGTDAADAPKSQSRVATEASATLSHAAITSAAPAAPKAEATPQTPVAPADTTLSARVEAVIAETPGAEGLTVQVANATVVLSGSVARYRELKVVLDTLKTWPTPPRVDYTTVDVQVRRVGARHTVAAAENLSQIALDYYGSANYAKLIEARNDLIGKPLPSGAELELPPLPGN